jgi:hypothetical protein
LEIFKGRDYLRDVTFSGGDNIKNVLEETEYENFV